MITWRVNSDGFGTVIQGTLVVDGLRFWAYQHIPRFEFTHPVVPPVDLFLHAMGKIETKVYRHAAYELGQQVVLADPRRTDVR